MTKITINTVNRPVVRHGGTKSRDSERPGAAMVRASRRHHDDIAAFHVRGAMDALNKGEHPGDHIEAAYFHHMAAKSWRNNLPGGMEASERDD